MSRPPRLPPPPDTPDLNVLGARFRDLMAKAELASVAAARLLWQARALFHDTNAWLIWCADTAMVGRRQAFYYARAAAYHVEVEQAGLLDAIPSEMLSVAMLAALAQIPVARLLAFLDTVDFREASADDVADMASDFMGHPRQPREFIRYRGPTPERLVAGLTSDEARKALDPIAELDLALAHIKRMQAVREKLTPQAREVAVRYFNNLAIELLQEAKA
jgi:hypothetical protein